MHPSSTLNKMEEFGVNFDKKVIDWGNVLLKHIGSQTDECPQAGPSK